MPTLPRADVFIARQSGPSQVLADPNMFNAEAQGIQQLGVGISQAAQAANQYALKMDHANYVAKSAEADRKVKTAWTAYQEQMETEKATPEKWAKGWNDVYAKVSKDIDTSTLSKGAQARLQDQLASFQADSSSQISMQATKQRIRNGSAEITASAGLDLKNGDWLGYESKIKEGAAAGFFDPATEIRLLDDGRKQFDFEQANKAINENAFMALDALEAKSEGGEWANFKQLDENRRLSLVREAKQYIARDRSETVQSIVERQSNGEIISDAELDGLVQSKRLLPTQAKWALQQQKRQGRDPEMVAEYANLLSAIDKYQPIQDPTQSQFAELSAQQLKYPTELRSEINRRLGEAKTNSATKRKEGYEYLDSLLAGSFLGDIDRSQSGTGKPSNPVEYQRAHERAVYIRQQLDEFLKGKPAATGPEQVEMVNKLTAKYRAEDGANMLERSRASSLPAPKTPKEYGALKPGTTYLAPDGTTRVKPAK